MAAVQVCSSFSVVHLREKNEPMNSLPVADLIGSNDRSSANVCQRSQSLFISPSGHNLIERSQLDSVMKNAYPDHIFAFHWFPKIGWLYIS